MEIITTSAEETINFAEKIAERCQGNEIIILNGELGSGKTTFTKGFAKALGISAEITSPTFTLMKNYYGGKFPLFHFDLYRVDDESELEELGFTEYLGRSGICVIEWNKFSDLKGRVINIDFFYMPDNTMRKIIVRENL